TADGRRRALVRQITRRQRSSAKLEGQGGAPRHDGMAARRIGITLLAQTNATTRRGRLSSMHPKITAAPLAKPRRIAVQGSKSTLRRMRRITLRLSPSSSRLLSSRPNMSSFETVDAAAPLLVQFARPTLSPIQSGCEYGKCRHNSHKPYEV